MSEQKLFTAEQLRIVGEYVQMYGLTPEQISFDGSETTPIFDYEATCLLSLKLTDIQSIDCWIEGREQCTDAMFALATLTRSSAKCTITLPDGRTRACEDSAQTGEIMGNGKAIDTVRLADSIAQNRAVRRGIRSVGVNLHNAHIQFKATGRTAAGHTDHDPRRPHYNEIHALATELDLIVDSDKSAYRHYLAEMFGGATSSTVLNDIELHQLLVSLRMNASSKRYKERGASAA